MLGSLNMTCIVAVVDTIQKIRFTSKPAIAMTFQQIALHSGLAPNCFKTPPESAEVERAGN